MSNETAAEQLGYLAKELSQTCQGLEDWPRKLLPPEQSWREYHTHLARLIFLICHVHKMAHELEPTIPATTTEEI